MQHRLHTPTSADPMLHHFFVVVVVLPIAYYRGALSISTPTEHMLDTGCCGVETTAEGHGTAAFLARPTPRLHVVYGPFYILALP